MKVVGLAAAVAVLAAGGYAAAANAHSEPPGEAGGAAAAYWNQSRLLGAKPWPAGRPGSARAALPAPGQTPAAHTAATALRVGALFEHDASGEHFCTASVVASPGEDLLVTAAHCLNDGSGSGNRSDIVFVPDYHDGVAPYGIWTPQRLIVAPQWANAADPDYDVGFVVLEPHGGQNIQQLLGANKLGFDTGYQQLVRVTGYPSSADSPITCLNWTTRRSATQMEFDCDGYSDGTSGSPWVTDYDPRSRTGTIVGIIGGYQEGGDTPSVSYSDYLSDGIHQLYDQALADQG